MKKIIVDVMGGDCPEELIKGGILASEKFKNIKVVLCGKEDVIQSVIKSGKYNISNIEILSADEVITNDDVPTMAIRTKKNSSMVVAVRALKDNDDIIGIISSGSTGALLTGATLMLGRMPGIIRPAMISFLPTQNDRLVAIADCGANVDSHAEQLNQYAIMGSICYKVLCGTPEPAVALLNVGVEDKKGNALAQEAFKIIKNGDLNFIGNMEARDALKGDVEVIVCDGFDGNILLKSIEGTAKMFSNVLKTNVKKSFWAKIGYLFMRGAMNNMKQTMDFNNYGGAIFLGVNKLVIKVHGASSALSIVNSIEQIIKMDDNKVLESIQSGTVEKDNESK